MRDAMTAPLPDAALEHGGWLLAAWGNDGGWASTSQGYNFWSGYSNKMLSSEDTALAREALRRWIEIAERGASK